MLCTAIMGPNEDRFRQRQLGVFETTTAGGGVAAMYRVPFFRTFWTARRFEDPEDLPLVGHSIPTVICR